MIFVGSCHEAIGKFVGFSTFLGCCEIILLLYHIILMHKGV